MLVEVEAAICQMLLYFRMREIRLVGLPNAFVSIQFICIIREWGVPPRILGLVLCLIFTFTCERNTVFCSVLCAYGLQKGG